MVAAVHAAAPPAPPARRLWGTEKVLYWMFCFSFALDFRGKESGSVALYLFLALFLACATFYLAATASSMGSRQAPAPSLRKIVVLWWLYLGSSAFTAFVMSVPADHYLKVLPPFFNTGLAMLVVRRLLVRNICLADIIKPVIYASFLATVWTAFYAMFISGLDISEARYQITSPVIPLVFAYGFWMMLVHKRPNLIELFTLLFAITLTVMSITRANLIVVAMLGLSFYLLRRSLPRARRRRRNLLAIVAVSMIMVFGLAIAVYLRPGTIESWQTRLFEQRTADNKDVTAMTRIAEYSGQWKMLTSSWGSAMVGCGLGATYTWDKVYTDQFGPEAEREAYVVWDGGHSFWVYSIYTGGLLFGWIVPGIYLLSMRAGWKTARQSLAVQNVRGDGRSWQMRSLPVLVLVAFLGFTFTTHPIASRFSGVVMGVFMALSWLPKARLSAGGPLPASRQVAPSRTLAVRPEGLTNAKSTGSGIAPGTV